MGQRLFSLSFAITAYAFDRQGKCYPSRVAIDGKTLYANTHTRSGAACFEDDGMQFWLQRKGESWYMVMPATF